MSGRSPTGAPRPERLPWWVTDYDASLVAQVPTSAAQRVGNQLEVAIAFQLGYLICTELVQQASMARIAEDGQITPALRKQVAETAAERALGAGLVEAATVLDRLSKRRLAVSQTRQPRPRRGGPAGRQRTNSRSTPGRDT